MNVKDLAVLTDPGGYLDDPTDMAAYAKEWRGNYQSHPLAVLRPKSTEEIAQIVHAAVEHGIAVIPQGGNTGLSGGSVVLKDKPGIILSLSRMTSIREVDALDYTLVAEAGCTLQQIQSAADDVGRYFPLSLAAEGTCQIGGNLSTNAGGVLTLRYGNIRALTLGLETVLPDGRIWNGLRRLRKDNTGYDLKQLFIGAEGTLGIITAAVLRLFPKPRSRETAFIAIESPQGALELLAHLHETIGDAVEAFELIPRLALDFTVPNIPGTIDPFGEKHSWYVLLEAVSGLDGSSLRDSIETALGDDRVEDAVIAASEAQRKAMWHTRESIPASQNFTGGMIPHDVAVPVSKVPRFICEVNEAIERLVPGTRPMPFGHVGDGNIHYTLVRPALMDGTDFLQRRNALSSIVYDIALSLGGTISAEHGIGLVKRGQLAEIKAGVELDMMRQIKQALDPANLLNPEKIV